MLETAYLRGRASLTCLASSIKRAVTGEVQQVKTYKTEEGEHKSTCLMFIIQKFTGMYIS